MPKRSRDEIDPMTLRRQALTFALRKKAVSIDEFERFVRETKALLKNVSRARLEIGAEWVLTDLKFSSAVMAYAPTLQDRDRASDQQLYERAHDVEWSIVDGIRAVEEATAKPPYFSERALSGLRRLSLLGDGAGISISAPNGPAVILTRSAADHIDVLLRPARKYYGSIVGDLDVVSVHKSPYVTVYGDHGDVVRCFLSQQMIDDAKDLLGDRVVVAGEITSNRFGNVVSIRGEELYEAPRRHSRPPSQTGGLIPDITGDYSISEYLDSLWPEEIAQS